MLLGGTYLSFMSDHMLSEIATLTVFMMADSTFVREIAQMHVFLMSGKIRFHTEGQVTSWLIAEERF